MKKVTGIFLAAVLFMGISVSAITSVTGIAPESPYRACPASAVG